MLGGPSLYSAEEVVGGGGWGSFMSLDGCPWPRSQLCLMSGSVQLGDTSSATDFAFITLPSSSRLFSHLHPPQNPLPLALFSGALGLE